MAKQMFATVSLGEIGSVVMVFGAVTDDQGDVAYAAYLAEAVNDPDPNAAKAPKANYSVTCTMKLKRLIWTEIAWFLKDAHRNEKQMRKNGP